MKRNYLILIPIIILLILSIIYLPTTFKIKQIVWIIISIVLFTIINRIKLKKILRISELLYIFVLSLLFILLIKGKVINGSKGWITLGVISIQPSEIMKISLILLTLKHYDRLNTMFLLLLYILPMLLIFLEPDTGGVLLIGIILLYFLKKKVTKKIYKTVLIIIPILIIITICIYVNKPSIFINIFGPSIFYRIDRLISFKNSTNIQTTNALISIASGNTLYFPEMYNDFFIAYILSKSIYLIIPIILSTVTILLLLIKKNTMISQIVFNIILWQSFWNLAMNLSIVPVIGIPYPFLSYGGSHIITNMILIALSLKKDDYNMEHIHNMKTDKIHKVDYNHMVG